MPAASLNPALDQFALPQPFRSAVARLLGFAAAERLYEELQATIGDQSFCKRLTEQLELTYRLSDQDLLQIPRSGPVVIVANHPFGLLEGALLATILEGVRPDVRFLANGILSIVPEISNLLISVNPSTGFSQVNSTGLRKSIDHLAGGGCLVVFPAGEVSHYQVREWAIEDSKWHTAVARIIEAVSRTGVEVTTIPLYIRGSNSVLFHAAGLIHSKLRTALLARELLNKRGKRIDLRIGNPISSKTLRKMETPKERTEYLRWRTYLLAKRCEYRANTSVPLRRRAGTHRQAEVCAATDPLVLHGEIRRLGRECLLKTTGDLDVYIASADSIPATLREIGRLREIAFRRVGEGTGKAIDLDRFDHNYMHLFAWNRKTCEIAGAYRLAGTDVVRDLYTATLFKYAEGFLEKMGPALELGRSFIRPEYQKTFAPLLALWKGIGAYIARNPRYRILFGAVSISNQYQSISRELMVSFLEKRAPLKEWMGLVRNRHPIRKQFRNFDLPGSNLSHEDLSDAVSDLEPNRAGIPVLLRQYLKLGGKLMGFNIDSEFSSALDGLILVDLMQTEPRLRERYLGKTEASRFLAFPQPNS